MNKNLIKYILSIPLILKFKLYKIIFGSNFTSNALSNINFHYATPYILKTLGSTIGSNVTIIGRITVAPGLKGFSTLTIEDNVFIGKNVFFDLAGEILIKKNTAISANCTFITHGDPGWRSEINRYYKSNIWSIKIYDNCWIGANVLISRNTTCYSSCIIASGENVIIETIPEKNLYKRNKIKKLDIKY